MGLKLAILGYFFVLAQATTAHLSGWSSSSEDKENLRGDGGATTSTARNLDLFSEGFVTGFFLVDAETGKTIGAVEQRSYFYLADIGTSFSLVAETEGEIGSVTFTTREGDFTHTENHAPYAMYGDKNKGDSYYPVDYLSTPGVKVVFATTDEGYWSYVSFVMVDSSAPDLTAAPVEQTNTPVQPTAAPVQRTIAPVQPTSAPVLPTDAPVQPTAAPIYPTSAPIHPTASPVAPAGLITGFTLIDTNTGMAIGPVGQRDSFSLSQVGTALSLQAETSGTIKTVTFTTREGDFSHTESVAPYAMDGNIGSTFSPVDYLSFAGVKVVFATTDTGAQLFVSFVISE